MKNLIVEVPSIKVAQFRRRRGFARRRSCPIKLDILGLVVRLQVLQLKRRRQLPADTRGVCEQNTSAARSAYDTC